MSSDPSVDCLVLRIIERDDSPRKFDQDLYVLHDIERDVFLIRGKRSDLPRCPMKSYTLECSTAYDTAHFISLIIPPEHRCVFELYSLDDLPADSNEITYDYLNLSKDPAKEVVAYLKQNTEPDKLVRLLRTLREVANNYE